MSEITVVSWASPSTSHLLGGIKQDCEKYGYSFFGQVIESDFQEQTHVGAYKAYFIQECLQRFEKIIYVDPEVRFVKKLPESWLEKKILVSRFVPPFSLQLLFDYNTGFLLLDRSHSELVADWVRVIERWNLLKVKKHQVDFRPEAPFFISDATAFFATLSVRGLTPDFVTMAWEAPLQQQEMRFGSNKNEYTYISQPFLHRWSKESSPFELYRMLKFHYSGDWGKIIRGMRERSGEWREHGWNFCFTENTYAPSHAKVAAAWGEAEQAHWDSLL